MKWNFILAYLSFLFLTVPAAAHSDPSDPAVAYANSHGLGQARYKQRWFGSGETRLHYVEAGKGPLVILYHGFPSNWFSWFDLMETLKGQYRVVAVDGLGAGLSGKPSSLPPYRIDRLGKQLDRLSRHLNGNRRYILIGHDWGAALSMAYAQAYPNRLHAVVGMSAPPYNLFMEMAGNNAEQKERSAYMQRFRTMTLDDVRKSGFAPRFARQVYQGMKDEGHLSADEAALFEASVGMPETMAGGVNWYRANVPDFVGQKKMPQWPKHNRPISVPALIIWGGKDTIFTPAFLDEMPRYASKLSVVRLPEVGHMTPIENSEQSSRRIAAFLTSLCVTAKSVIC